MKRAFAVLGALAVTAPLAACGGSGLPPTVLEGTEATVAWGGALSSVNTAGVEGATPGNLDVSQVTRSQFAREREGTVTTDPSFGAITIEDESESSFTLRYDLASPAWSDGIALDAADLMLAWAAGSNFFAGGQGSEGTAEDPLRFDSVITGMTLSDEIPEYDEFDRWIEVSFERPFVDWQTALDVAVPAHVVGQRALGVDDPMEAKTAVIDAIADGDEQAIAEIARLWNEGFTVTGEGGLVSGEQLTLSSGPFRVEQIEGGPDDAAQRVTLVANGAFAGQGTPSYERVVLQRHGEIDLATDLAETYDVVQVMPSEGNFEAVRELERTDHGVTASDRGELWVAVARLDGSSKLSDAETRGVFLRSFDRGDVVEAGAGAWADEYAPTSSVLFPPGTDGYQISLEDAGFNDRFRSRGDAFDERQAADIPEHSTVCVLYDTDSALATGMFRALESIVAEAGWIARDCGNDDPDGVTEVGGDWDLMITKVRIPETPAEIAAQWGTDGALNHSGAESVERDELIQKLARTTDQYEARDLRVAIEKTIIDQMAVAPLTMDTIITVDGRDIDGVMPRSGRVAPLLATAVAWNPVVPESGEREQGPAPAEDDEGGDGDIGGIL